MLEAELGFKGERGYSNYELAVKNGYQGTEAEWLAQFGVDFNVCVMKDDILVWSGSNDPEDPDAPIFETMTLPTGWTLDNTIILCIKERVHNDEQVNPWYVNGGGSSTEHYERLGLAWIQEGNNNTYQAGYWNPYYNIQSIHYDFQITFMKVDIPQV